MEFFEGNAAALFLHCYVIKTTEKDCVFPPTCVAARTANGSRQAIRSVIKMPYCNVETNGMSVRQEKSCVSTNPAEEKCH